jgi:choline dehydrogenase-like flavoprotein
MFLELVNSWLTATAESILVIESGESVENDQTMIPYKANDFAGSASLLWTGINSKPEPGLGGASYPVAVAKVLGGGSVINGMVYDRGSAADYDAWEALGNNGWGWAGMEPYFKKGVTFQPPSEKIAKEFGITWDESTYGNGPLTVSITDSQFEDVKDNWSAWNASGVHIPVDGNSGEAYGASWYPNTMDKTTGRRAHARYAYLDPFTSRTNLNVLTKTTATQIKFDDKKRPTMAKGVDITDNATGRTSTVYAKREVILAAGAIQTPKLLQLSGIGPRSILEAAGVKVRVELDAVGSNYQDHPYATILYNTTTDNLIPNSLTTNTTYNASAWQEYVQDKTGPYTYARGNALAFIPLPNMVENTDAIARSIKSQDDEAYLPAIYKGNRKLLKGFARQREIIANLFTRSDAAVAEYGVQSDDSFNVVGVEKPLSRGTVYLNPSNPTGPPDVTHNAFVNPVDRSIIGIGLRFYRSVMAQPVLNHFKISELVPGSKYSTDDEIFDALLAQGSLSPTLAHSSGSCPMMPEHAGGCVNDKLMVYGTQHLSIIDASIIPLIPACHLQATMYGIAEKAADIIKAR